MNVLKENQLFKKFTKIELQRNFSSRQKRTYQKLIPAGFKAEVGELHNAHHILLFGCDEPGSSEMIW